MTCSKYIYIWVLILIGCYKHTFDFISNCDSCRWCCNNLGDKADAILYQNLQEWRVSGVFWLPSIFYTLRFHNYKSSCTCWRRTTARLTTIGGNFNYKIGTVFKQVHTIISSLYTAALCFSLHQLIHQESTTCGLQDTFCVMFRLILPENVQ